MDKQDLFDFPCTFPIKIIGKDGLGFKSQVTNIVRRHAPDLDEGAVTCKTSGKGKYISITITINATSREQLDAIYHELTVCGEVLMAL